MPESLKPLEFVGSSLDDLRDFPEEARRAVGVELMRVQYGGMPQDFKALPAVGSGAYEIRVHAGRAWRAIYVAKFEAAVYVLHAFEKKTRKTAKSDIALAAMRYKMITGKKP
jgi:phage-related protein